MKSGSKSGAGPVFFNTLSKKKEVFETLSGREVKMYNCGPTVYNYAHVGNLRAYIFVDVLRRTLEENGFSVKQVLNITDVGHLTSDADVGADKIEEGAKKEGKTAKEISEFYTRAFFDDLKKLNIETAGTLFPKATEHIAEQIDLIKVLEEKGFTYKTSDGVYFDTSRFKNYGKLGAVDLTGLLEGARIGVNALKKNPTDFALWKFSRPDEKRQQEWPSPWGVGFPGWHIECSAMSMKYLGETIDIHTGGIDHIPVHHNNEIAQSEAATGKQFVRFWLHNAHVNMSGVGGLGGAKSEKTGEGAVKKMAKSSGNFIRLATLEERNIEPLAFKYWILTAHYRSPITFSFEAVGAAEAGFRKLIRQISELPDGGATGSNAVSEEYSRKFKEIINDDLDTPKAISLIWELLKDTKISPADKKTTILSFDHVLGLNIKKLSEEFKEMTGNIPPEIKEIVEKRENARKEKDWEAADLFRGEIKAKGYIVDDSEEGPLIRRAGR